ncbi:DUF4437 domain-containing protein [Maribacter polysaccharolyticus]|uniref:DUF4437 domain-containing protein n=1 Tax=Maribacter polysaccharolyticus TaxID=3020831 RepID=UPI00237F77D6|nr:DUF4437 domain-containing protein [Maribacter polysaccharolyticus]MDE3741285.1 DUF4437 domain-containing protein [Maribacter polysaccharolyticus]
MDLRLLYVSLAMTLMLSVSCNDRRIKTENKISEQLEKPTNKVVLSSEVKWEKLNPAGGDQSPLAGTIWGDRNGIEATGFLVRFADGFSSPPHIHNITYRAVVISGAIHNDDPQAEKMWMKPGSFWTQPLGESHITASKGESMALVEIDNGPYLVKPINKAFDNGERPLNIDVSNVVWLNKDQSNWLGQKGNPEISFLWESKGYKGLFVKLPKGFNGTMESNGTVLHSVVIQGELHYEMPNGEALKVLDSGSYFGATHKTIHNISNSSAEAVVVYIRTNGDVKINEI